MAFAGVWSLWEADGRKLHTCCIVTTTANELVRPFHDRMPVILRPEDYDTWLDNGTDLGELKSLLKPYPAELMETWEVDPRVNKATVEGPELVARVGAA
jgi:putative SOS response-associated peptidase YedK